MKSRKHSTTKLVIQQQVNQTTIADRTLTTISTSICTNTVSNTYSGVDPAPIDNGNAVGPLLETSSCLKNSRMNGVSPKRTPHGPDVKRITFDESCKKESLDDNYRINQESGSTLRPPTPVRPGYGMRFLEPDIINPNYLSAHLATEIRRHSSHATTSTVREYDKDKDRRYSGYNTNHLSLSSEHAPSNRFLSTSPAASRRISYGSLFKVNHCFSIIHRQ